MRLKFLLLFLVIFGLLCDFTLAGKDSRKKNRNKSKHQDDQEEDDEERRSGGGLGISEDKRKETKDRVMDLQERAEERKERHEKKEEESSEEKDKDKDEKSNSTEIVIPVGRFRRHKNSENLLLRHRRNEHSLKKASEINDGQQTALDTKPKQDHQCGANCNHKSRIRRHEHTLKRAGEINDGQQTALDTKPSQDHQCGPNCKHNKRSVTGSSEEDDEIETNAELHRPVRNRRAKGKGKDIGHRVATHPHTSKRTGIKAGRRRGQNQQQQARADGKQRKAKSRQARHLEDVSFDESFEERPREPKTLNDVYVPNDDDIIRTLEPNGWLRLTYGHHRRIRGVEVAPAEPIDRSRRNHKKSHDDTLVVSADAATITDF